MPADTRVNFVRQQGFRRGTRHFCERRYPALMLQPRLIGILLLVGIVLNEAWFFLALVFGRFCLGSYLFLHLRGEADFARRTAPWS